MRVGLEPIDACFVFENHDEALEIWRREGVRRRTLVHIDAHHDFWLRPPDGPVTIANFVSQAVREDLVGDIYWVVPDRSWDSLSSRRAVERHLKKIAEDEPGARFSRGSLPDGPSISCAGRTVRAGSLRALPRLEEDVLLDIDVDYLTIPYVSYGVPDRLSPRPWRWPEELIDLLKERGSRTRLATIAYSVEGGYTPLHWKYLGDELRERLSRPGQHGARLQSMEAVRRGALQAEQGRPGPAEEAYREAARLWPGSAAAHLPLASLLAESGRIEEARDLYREALAADPSANTAYNSEALRFRQRRLYRRERAEHIKTLRLDPGDRYALFGLGRLAARRRRWREAEARLRESLRQDPGLMDSLYFLGRVLAKRRRWAEAVSCYEAYLKQALRGGGMLSGGISTEAPEAPHFKDGGHGRVYLALSRLYARQGALDRAISAARMGLAAGADGPLDHGRAALLLLRGGQTGLARKEMGRAVRALPARIGRLGPRLRRRLRLFWRNRFRTR